MQRAPISFDLVGASWSGPASTTAELRVRGRRGWTSWQPLERDRTGASEPVWTGRSRLVQVRLHGPARAARLHFVRSDDRRSTPTRALAEAGVPPIISRAAWGADESIRRRAALVAPDLRLAFVHHTATANDYPPEQSAAIVRSIYAYHVRHNGWNDIGYAFLIDRYGQIFEGRAGGVEQAIVGAHAQGFNTGSVGIALIGNGSLEPITPAARSSLVQLLTWRLDLAHLDPLARSSVTSRGNPRFPAGATVALRTISGHRDVDATGCPGDLVEPELDAIAREVAAAPVPRIVSPRIGRLADGSIHLSARLLAASAWTITLLDAAGAPVATTAGAGPAVEWISPPGTATSWRIEAVSPSGEPARAATGRLSGGPAPPPIGLTAAPGLISPDGDGVADTATIATTLSLPATVSVVVSDEAGQTVAQIVAPGPVPAGPFAVGWDGGGLPDGRYRIGLHAVLADGSIEDAAASVTILRAASSLQVTSSVNATSPLRVRWQQISPGSVSLELRGNHRPFTLESSSREAGSASIVLSPASRPRLPQGAQVVVLRVTTPLGVHELRAALTIDTVPPRIAVVAVRRRHLVLRLGETSVVRVRRGTRVIAPRARRVAGVLALTVARPPGTPALITIEAVDAAGNRAVARVFSGSG